MHLVKSVFLLLTSFLLLACQDKAQQALVDSMTDCLTHFRAESYKVASTTCHSAMELGSTQAAWLLGHLAFYDLSKTGSTKQQGFGYYLKAAEKGWPDAYTLVGESYMFGEGVEKNFDLAHQWFLKAAELKDADAQFALGELYFSGLGREKDLSQAIAWFKRSAEQSHVMSINNLAWIYATSTHQAFRDADKALYWAEQLVKFSQENPMFLDTIAAAHALANQFEHAIALQTRAIELLPEEVAADERQQYQKHLQAYVNGLSWLDDE